MIGSRHGNGLRFQREDGLGCRRIEGKGAMLVQDPPLALLPLTACSEPHPGLHCRMILVFPGETEQPVGECQIAAHENPEVPRLYGERIRLPRRPILVGLMTMLLGTVRTAC